LARTEVAAARSGAEIVVVGGYLASGETSARVDAYSPSANRWRRLPDLPVAVNHAMAATWRGRAIVAGGYGGPRQPLRTAFELVGGRWRSLPQLPSPRAAAGAAVVGDALYVMGGVGPAGLARSALALDLKRKRWRTIPGPTPREHLAVASAGGRVYVLAGRTAGLDTNLGLLERYDPRTRRWRRLRPVSESRGGTGAAAAAGLLVSVGGEAPGGTIATVYGYDLRTGRWRRLPDLPTPRHGLGVVAVGRRIYVLAGGPQPGLHVSAANEVLQL
jgi:non-specific serine/threonine protein kinase